MQNTEAATTAQNGQSYTQLDLSDIGSLRAALKNLKDNPTALQEFDELHAKLVERYGAESVDQTINRIKEESERQLPKIILLDDFMYELIQEPPRLIDGVLHKGGVMLVSGAAKTNKSWTAKEICISIAQGNPWLDFSCDPGRVLFVNNEIKAFTLQKRLRGLMDENALGPVPKGSISLLNLRGVQTDISQLADSLIETVDRDQFSAIIIDPIYTLLGKRDENDNGDVKEVGNMLTYVAEMTGAAVIFVHHHSKGTQGNKRSLERASGAGAWGRFPDSVLDITLQSEKERLFRMSLTLRDFEAPDDFLARRIAIGPRWDRSEIRPEELEADTEAAKKAEKEEKDGQLFKDIADLVRDGEKVSSAEWERRCDAAGYGGRRKFLQARTWLLEQGIAFKALEKGPNNSDLYFFPANIGRRFDSQN